MGRSFFRASGKQVLATSANAIIQAKQLRAAILNGIVKGELVLGASLNAYTSLFTQYILNASLNAYTVPGTTLLNGIQRYYKLDGDAVDSVAGANGTTPNVTWVAGKLGTAANFNNDTSRQVVAPSLDLMTAITVSAWVYFTGTNSFAPVVCQMSSGGGTTLNYAVMTSGTGLTFYGTGNAPSATAPAMSQNMWHHVVATRTLSGTAQFWIDNVAQTPAAGPAPYSVPGASFRIGNRDDNYADFPGYIDEVGVWNRVLTASEIAELYNHQVGQTYPFGAKATLLTQIGAYWKLDGNSTDELATANGTDTNITYSVGNGKISQGAGFDGTTSKVVLPNVASLKPTTITASAWIKTTEAGSYRTIVNSTHQVSTVCGWELRKNSSNKLEFILGNNTNLSQGSGYQFSASTQSINDGVWHHVCGTYDGGYVRTYIDGTLDGAVAFAGGAIAYDSDPRVRIGVNNYVGSTEVYFWSGALDEIGVWSRALDAEEILNLYNANLGQQYPFTSVAPITTGLVSYYKLDGNSTDELAVNTGTDTAVTYSAANGVINSGAGFNGTTSYIDLGSTASLNFKAMTFSAWVKNNSTANYHMIVTRGGSGAGVYELRFEIGSGILGYITSSNYYPMFAPALGVWHHVCFTRTAAGFTTIYVNGAVAGTTTFAIPSLPSTATFLGKRSDGYWLDGSMDEVGFWSRVLTADEVTTVYNGGAGVQYPLAPGSTPLATRQKAYWKLDGNSTDELGVYTGTDVSVAYAAAKINSGAVFSGGTSTITVSSMALGNVYTVAGWVNPTSYANAYLAIVADNAGAHGLFIQGATGRVDAAINSVGYLSVATVPLSTWTHVAYTVWGSTLKLYINGVLDSTQTVGTTNFPLTRIGTDIYGAPDSFVGSIDELGVWTRALSEADIVTLYNAGAGIQYPF